MDDGIVQVTAPLAAALIYDHMSIGAAFAVIAGLNLASGGPCCDCGYKKKAGGKR